MSLLDKPPEIVTMMSRPGAHAPMHAAPKSMLQAEEEHIDAAVLQLRLCGLVAVVCAAP